MFTRQANQNVDAFILIHWLLMSLCAGMMNSVAFVGLGTFATHVTGFGTLFGVHAAGLQWKNAMAALAVPLFFLGGSIISGLCVESRVRRNKQPHYDYVMYGCCILLLFACFLGQSRGPEIAQTEVHLSRNFVLLSLICLSSGLINAALSASSRSTVRITHLTGVTTDLGRGIAELITVGITHAPDAQKELKLNLLRVFTILSFMSGALLGAILFREISFYVLLIPGLYCAYAGMHAYLRKADFRSNLTPPS